MAAKNGRQNHIFSIYLLQIIARYLHDFELKNLYIMFFDQKDLYHDYLTSNSKWLLPTRE